MLIVGAFACTIIPCHAGASEAVEEGACAFWPQWRGPLGSGVAPLADPPVEWSEKKNIRWKLQLPGKGHSTPIVWGDRIFVTTAAPFGESREPVYSGSDGAHDVVPITHQHEFIVLAASRDDGTIIWQKTVHRKLPHEGTHYTSSLASPSAVTDGEFVFAFFGSRGLYCLDWDGESKWQVDLGKMYTLHAHGEGSSPVLHGDSVLILWDHEGPSFLAAFNKRTGAERWRVVREELSSWSTPIVVEREGGPQVIVSGSKRVTAYDLATGKTLWRRSGLSVENVVATPVAGHGMVYAGSTYDRNVVMAIRLERPENDSSGEQPVAWTRTRGAPYVPSFLLYGDALYFHHHFQGILTRVNAVTGEDQPGPIRLEGLNTVFGSPIGAAGRVYATDVNGVTIVFRDNNDPEILALNKLEDRFSASPAAAAGELYLRGEKYLYCIAEDATRSDDAQEQTPSKRPRGPEDSP
jgi:hypothetical protein